MMRRYQNLKDLQTIGKLPHVPMRRNAIGKGLDTIGLRIQNMDY
ncbi:hypothetical protein [Bartonella henselae]|nr:hypothetical protein [Bartonella henselae]MDM9997007.1 hypothetical protein [Bartonella henselae]